MADLTREEMQRLARLGAKARLEELRQEESAIRGAFPDLFRGGRGRKASAHDMGASAALRKRRRSNMSAAARKAVSERMKKYWAARRKEKK